MGCGMWDVGCGMWDVGRGMQKREAASCNEVGVGSRRCTQEGGAPHGLYPRPACPPTYQPTPSPNRIGTEERRRTFDSVDLFNDDRLPSSFVADALQPVAGTELKSQLPHANHPTCRLPTSFPSRPSILRVAI